MAAKVNWQIWNKITSLSPYIYVCECVIGYNSQSSDTAMHNAHQKLSFINRRASPPLENNKQIGHDNFILANTVTLWNTNTVTGTIRCSDSTAMHNAHQKLSSQSQGITAPWKLQIGHDKFILATWNVTQSHQHCDRYHSFFWFNRD